MKSTAFSGGGDVLSQCRINNLVVDPTLEIAPEQTLFALIISIIAGAQRLAP